MKVLALSIGNSSFRVGVFSGERLVRNFRVPISQGRQPRLQAAGFGLLFARRVRGKIDRAVLCSVVPALTGGVARQVVKTFGVHPRLLTADAPHGMIIGYRNPGLFGMDRLAAAMGARRRFGPRDMIVVDCGTATTVTALRRDGTILGGAILPGLTLWPEVLSARTAQLPRVVPHRPKSAIGRSPREAIASGTWIGHVGAVRELVRRVREDAFGGNKHVAVVGTGGHAAGLHPEGIFNVFEPDLILLGLRAFATLERDCAP